MGELTDMEPWLCANFSARWSSTSRRLVQQRAPYSRASPFPARRSHLVTSCSDLLLAEIVTEVLEAIEAAYGCGTVDRRGRYENVAWIDFCEDVERARKHDQTNGYCEALAATRGAKISFEGIDIRQLAN
jgi:hypothetical protein